MEAVFEWVAQYGTWALFGLLMLGIVGLPVPDETLMVFSGYLIATGKLSAFPTWLAALAGAWCGITVSYLLGRYLGFGFVHRFGRYVHLDATRLEALHNWFHHTGHWALFFGYYIAGVRHFTAIVAGTSRLEFRTFATYAWAGGLLWVTSFLTLGYFLGDNWKEIAEAVHHYALLVSIAVLILFAGYLLLHRRLMAQIAASGSKPPR